MKCEQLYDSLEPLAGEFRETRDFFGGVVKAFRVGREEYPPLLIVGDLTGCARSSEVIADALLRYAGDTYIIAIPCPFPTLSDGMQGLSRALTGTEASNYGEFKLLAERSLVVVHKEGSLSAYSAGNVLLIFLDDERSLSRAVEIAKELNYAAVFAVLKSGDIRPLNTELLTSHLSYIFEEARDLLLSVYVECALTAESCMEVPEELAPRLYELAKLAVSQTDEETLCSSPPSGGKIVEKGIAVTSARTPLQEILPNTPILKLVLGTKNYSEAANVLLAVFNSAYLLRAHIQP